MKKVYNDSTLNISKEAKFEKPLNFNIEVDCNKHPEDQTEKDNFGDEFF